MRLCKIARGGTMRLLSLMISFFLISTSSMASVVVIEYVKQSCSDVLSLRDPMPGNPMAFRNLQKMNKWLTSNLLEKYKSEAQYQFDMSVTPEMRAREIFNHLVRIRLTLLPAGIQSPLLAILHSSSITYEFPFAVWGGSGHASKGKLTVNTHGALRDSAFVLHTLIHEIEHQIQFLLFNSVDSTQWLYSQGISLFMKKIFLRYQQELGAMYLEWMFFHLLPKSDLTYWQAKLDSVGAPIFRDRDSLQRSLDGAQLPFEEYLSREHKAGRYSLQSLAKAFWEDRKGDRVPLN
jgi:hypothetical protein